MSRTLIGGSIFGLLTEAARKTWKGASTLERTTTDILIDASLFFEPSFKLNWRIPSMSNQQQPIKPVSQQATKSAQPQVKPVQQTPVKAGQKPAKPAQPAPATPAQQ
jgi:hypothetical protein